MDETKLYIIIFILLIAITVSVILIKSNVTILEVFNKIVRIILRRGKYTDREEVENIMITAGYDYDEKQDIFYSREDAWQKSYGYCRFYDETASAFSMVIDSEPIYFQYNDRKWLIEFWKGQYGMCSGGEVGVYQTEKDSSNKVFNSTYYNALEDEAQINIKFSLFKNNREMFTREGEYWWITGFILGEFSEPEELSMDIEIIFENKAMCDAFLGGLRASGYSDEEFKVDENTVKLKFDKPKTEQPLKRKKNMDKLQQMNNKILCNRYQAALDSNLNSFDKLVRLKEIKSDLFDSIKKFLVNNQLIEIYKNSKKL